MQAFVSDLRALNFSQSKIEDFAGLKYFGVLPTGTSTAPVPQKSETYTRSNTESSPYINEPYPFRVLMPI